MHKIVIFDQLNFIVRQMNSISKYLNTKQILRPRLIKSNLMNKMFFSNYAKKAL